ncbi:glutathione-regulated potassium-efflux system protein KefB [Aggregicoccus sp. 17bor-14]|uniref:monovalent cation:proton antiporter-2 (CPA2) family protein n=1 Tax=Myxococcaceae TaxID=31 RepID=UPI00129C38FA|nr:MULTISPECIES: monovalent cation:proton antiporter-2 (CPA2) family protein [Myxococcaceae]MBF5046409.1 cation:proton antiporter [Simulacricoccus sp. 17bor-14]MRI92129.1 glutathione-regulated potassium-efflux system protein KefB [Aggregicoccus sp. 17bor-14]
MSWLQQALIFLAATVVSVPLFKRLGLGSVLGYLAAGAVIGPWGLRLIGEVEAVMHISEFGVVLLLFLIGLELQPSRLWELRRGVFGLGGAQVLLSALLLGAVGMALGLSWRPALVAGLGLSLSSTAFALQLLAEKNELTQDHGRAAFGILLFQDLAVIPILALLPFLADGGAGAAAPSSAPGWVVGLKVVGVLAAVVLGAPFVVRPLFKIVANTHSQELFTATALLVVLGTAVGVSQVGLSPALGAFLAGVLLANSEFKHELEADIEPFKGLLLGLFFLSVGMSVNLGLIAARPLGVAALVLLLVLLKGVVLYGLGRWSLRSKESGLDLAVVISQGGEFAFVLFSLAVAQRVMDRALADLLVVVVSLSMGVTPLLYLVHERLVRPRLRARRQQKRDFDVAATEDNPVIIAGMGRVGQVVARVLAAKRIGFTAMDINSEHIDFLRRFGTTKVFYGDAARLDLLRAARADKAKVLVVAVDDAQASVHIVQTAKQHFPQLTIIARARNRQHAYALLDLGVVHVMRETFAASLEMTQEVLEELTMGYSEARESIERFRELDEAMLLRAYRHQGDEKKLAEISQRGRQELEQLFAADEAERRKSS